MKQKDEKNGFTLFEIILTMAIIVIVAMVLVPALQSIQSHAKNATVRATLAELRAAIQSYSAREIAEGRASRSATGQNAGWPILEQVDDSQYSTTTLPKILPGGDVPENPWAKEVFSQDYDRVLANTGAIGSGASGPQAGLFLEGVAYAEYRFHDDPGGGGGGGGGGDPPPDPDPDPGPTPAGWFYNPNTGAIWAATNVNGENGF